ncbi:MAG: uroporphyrinogen decarboxylase [Candidatus Marinimicrobia bacterium]|nr:uroporphyrinogen decarboxylase [Candidatus Neomarinimicrobiota bacterium]MCH7954737.1 uroporphyrinogen decarboxylase [Candidatus Neomarinimicrobiota bacterium]
MIIDAIKCKPVNRTPIWIMRQAGRYLPQYRELRGKVTLLEAFHSPEIAAELTLQPIELLSVDAAIIYSDILLIPEALGMSLDYIPGKGPVFGNPLRSEPNVERLRIKSDFEDKLSFVSESIRNVKSKLDSSKPLIGFVGSPWTLAVYMIEGESSKSFVNAKTFIYKEPDLFKELLELLTEAVTRSLKLQINAGADLVQIFDSWAGLLNPQQFSDISLASMKEVIKNLDGSVPVIVFAKGAGHSVDVLADSGADCLGIDWGTSLSESRKTVNNRVALQGNLDPVVLLSNPEKVREETIKVLEAYGKGNGHIFNLGHGILPETPVENVKTLIETVRSESPEFHKES